MLGRSDFTYSYLAQHLGHQIRHENHHASRYKRLRGPHIKLCRPQLQEELGPNARRVVCVESIGRYAEHYHSKHNREPCESRAQCVDGTQRPDARGGFDGRGFHFKVGHGQLVL